MYKGGMQPDPESAAECTECKVLYLLQGWAAVRAGARPLQWACRRQPVQSSTGATASVAHAAPDVGSNAPRDVALVRVDPQRTVPCTMGWVAGAGGQLRVATAGGCIVKE